MKATSARVRPGRLRKIENSIVFTGFFLILMSGSGLFWPSFRAQTATKGATLSVALKYLETGAIATRIEMGRQDVRFRKEPEFGKNDKVVRQALKIGSNPGDFVGFAVNFTSGTLYLDLNQNLDLTDDPQGIYKSNNARVLSGGSASSRGVNIVVYGSGNTQTRSALVAMFRGVRLNLSKNGIDRSYMLEPFYYLGTDSPYIGIRSLYASEIDLHGRRWLFQVQDNLDGQLDASDRFLITAVAGKSEPKPISYRPMPVPKNLFLDGRQYRLDFAFGPASGNAPLTVTLTEHASPLTQFTLEGQFVRRLVLEGEEHLVVLDAPGQTVSLPADNYRIQGVYLQQAPGKPTFVGAPATPRFAATADAPYRLKVGAPFVGSVVATRKGNVLQMQYVLKGAAGEEYSIVNPDRGNPPKFVIYKGDQKVADGSFQFG